MAGTDVGDYPATLVPVGAANTMPLAETFPRMFASGTVNAPSTGVMNVAGIWLTAGLTISAITFVSGSTAESNGQHLWYALYKGNNPKQPTAFTLMAQTTDNTTAAAFGANTAFRQTLTAAQKLTYTGFYYLAFMNAIGAGAVPTLLNSTNSVTNATGAISGMTPILCGTADSGLTTTAPSTMGAITTINQYYYAFVD